MNSEHPSAATPVRRTGLIDQAAALFRAEVVSGRWPVGSRIPTEVELVRTFGIGRNTAREALQSLVHAGLLRREQGRGTFVISDSELTGPLGRHLAGGTRRHYLELRLALDSSAAALAARRRTAADVTMLRDLRDRRAATWSAGSGGRAATGAGSDGAAEERAVADLALHRAVVAATHNPLYLELYSSMVDVFALHMDHDENGDEVAALDEHHALVEAIAEGDPVRAAAQVQAIFEPLMH